MANRIGLYFQSTMKAKNKKVKKRKLMKKQPQPQNNKKIEKKKRKLTKKQPQNNNFEKNKLKNKKLQKTLAAPKDTQTQNDYDNDSSSSCQTGTAKIQKLFEPYTKDQLVDFIIDASVKDTAILTRIHDAAHRDVSHRKIFVYGLGWDTTREALVSAFESFGQIEDCNVITDHSTGKAKGYGFVLFKTRQGAAKALKQPRKKISNLITSCWLASVEPEPEPVPVQSLQSQDTAWREIYVSNVQADVDQEELRAFFSKFGEIETGPIGFDAETGKSRGFAFFVYKTHEAVRKVLQEPYKMFEGHRLHCQKVEDGKNMVKPVQVPVLAAVTAAQKLVNLNAGLFLAGSVTAGEGGLGQGVIGSRQDGQVGGAGGSLGSMTTGLGVYGETALHGLGSLGGSPSVLGVYGSGSVILQGLQDGYPSPQIGQTLSARAPGAGGSFSVYPFYLPEFTNVTQSDKVMDVVPSISGQVKHCANNFSMSLGMGMGMHVDSPLCSFIVDGTWFRSTYEAGFAWVAFDEHGRRIAQDNQAFFAVSAGVVEAIASLEALKWAARQGFRNVALSTDCLDVVKALKDETSCNDCALVSVIMDIRGLCNSFDYVLVKKAERQVVHEAHVLARAALGRTS